MNFQGTHPAIYWKIAEANFHFQVTMIFGKNSQQRAHYSYPIFRPHNAIYIKAEETSSFPATERGLKTELELYRILATKVGIIFY